MNIYAFNNFILGFARTPPCYAENLALNRTMSYVGVGIPQGVTKQYLDFWHDNKVVLSESLPTSFSKDKKFESTFKLIVDCNGRIDMVIYKKGNLSESQQKT